MGNLTPISPHFSLQEFLPRGWDGTVPIDVRANLVTLCWNVLEPARQAMGRPLGVNSGWRPPSKNAAVGGVPTSDHLVGRAADVHCHGDRDEPWEAATIRLFHWLRENADIGQLILEDHRVFLASPGKLWVHVAIPSPKHPGFGDPSRILYSRRPGVYEPWKTGLV